MIDDLLPKVVGVDMSSFQPTVGNHDQGFLIDSSEYSTADSDDASEDSDDDTSDTSNDNNQPDVALPTPPPKKARRVYVRKPMYSTSAWWTAFLSQEANAILINEPHGKDARSFCRAF